MVRHMTTQHKMQADYYKVLGLKPNDNPSTEEVKKSYFQLAQLYHPDKNDSGVNYECHEIFLMIVEAYDVLSNPQLRAKYDAEIGLRPESEEIIIDHPFAVYRAHGGYRKYKFDESNDG